jgi:uncharacterized DUF497 family protein
MQEILPNRGYSNYLMVWTQRGEARHIISMRHCQAKEEELWLRRMGRFR